jgi:uncharacterized protein YpmS
MQKTAWPEKKERKKQKARKFSCLFLLAFLHVYIHFVFDLLLQENAKNHNIRFHIWQAICASYVQVLSTKSTMATFVEQVLRSKQNLNGL